MVIAAENELPFMSHGRVKGRTPKPPLRRLRARTVKTMQLSGCPVPLASKNMMVGSPRVGDVHASSYSEPYDEILLTRKGAAGQQTRLCCMMVHCRILRQQH
jgi:hypothetical protein